MNTEDSNTEAQGGAFHAAQITPMRCLPDYEQPAVLDKPTAINEPPAIVFSPDDRLESRCTYHADKEVNREQAKRLMANLLEKREELILAAFIRKLGKRPTEAVYKKNARIIKEEGEGEKASQALFWLFWGNSRIAVWTAPDSRIYGRFFVLRWYFKFLGDQPNE